MSKKSKPVLLFNVDIGNIDDKDIKKYVKKYAKRFRKVLKANNMVGLFIAVRAGSKLPPVECIYKP